MMLFQVMGSNMVLKENPGENNIERKRWRVIAFVVSMQIYKIVFDFL